MSKYIRDQVLREIELAQEILGIDKDLKPKKGIRAQDILVFLNKVRNEVWPENSTNLLPPKFDDNQLRGFYWGDRDANSLANIIIRQCLFFDQVLLLDPIASYANAMGPDGPYTKPGQWIQEIVNDAIYLCSMKEWIEKGLVFIFPPQSSLDFKIFTKFGNEMKTKYGSILHRMMCDKSYKEKQYLNVLRKQATRLPKEIFLKLNRADYPVKFLIELFDDVKSKHPIRYVYSEIEADITELKDSDDMYATPIRIGTGCNLIEAQVIGSETNSVIFTDDADWEVLFLENDKNISDFKRELQQLAFGVKNLEFEFLNFVPLNTVLNIRQQGYLQDFRNLLRDLWKQIEIAGSLQDLYFKAKEFNDRLVEYYGKYKEEMKNIRTEIARNVITKTFDNHLNRVTGVAAFISGCFNWELFLMGVAVWLAQSFKPISETMKKKETLRQNPLFVLYESERKSK